MSFSLSLNEIEQNILKLKKIMNAQNLDAFYVSSYDEFLNEYVPREECYRYYFTGFTGSVAEILVPKSGRVLLFVDGRYHEQADLEIDDKLVEVVKCNHSILPFEDLLSKIQMLGYKKIGAFGNRSLKTDIDSINKFSVIEFIDSSSIDIDFSSYNSKSKIRNVEGCTKEIKEFNDKAFFTSKLDSIAWATGLRGFQLPFQATFKAKMLYQNGKAILLVPNLELVEQNVLNRTDLEFIESEATDSKLLVSKLISDELYINEDEVSALDYSNFSNEKKVIHHDGLTNFQANKNQQEIECIERAFFKSDKIIFNSLCEVLEKDENFTEKDFFNLVNKNYEKAGALSLSFNTISSIGSNSSIIHFSSPSEEVKLKDSELILLDSGALYETGFATDTTRVVIKGQAKDWQKEIYTLTLKSLISAFINDFPKGISGKEIDEIIRRPIKAKGYDYAHGTGHGVGINVHEGGYSITPRSTIILQKNRIGSIEPGIYLPGKGGVRLENIVKVEEVNEKLRLIPIVYIGFFPELIKVEDLTSEEKSYLKDYETICQSRGTGFGLLNYL